MTNEKNKWDIPAEPSDLTSRTIENDSTQPMQIEDDLSVQEIITGQLSDNVVIFVGPREVGKTVALIRLTHFIRKKRDCKIEPNRTYRNDKKYLDAVNEFLNDQNQTNFNPERTGNINFLVLDVMKNGNHFCQFLEAPGEAFFDPNNPHDDSFPAYLVDIFNNSNINKTFVIFYEQGMLLDSDPMAYSSRLARIVSMMNRKKDDVIILFNKCDKHRNLYNGNKPNDRAFKNLLYNNNDYDDFFGSLKTYGVPVKFIPFSSGTFQKIPNSSKERWIHSDDAFPEKLWLIIEKSFKRFTW